MSWQGIATSSHTSVLNIFRLRAIDQIPLPQGDKSGGQREFIPFLARAAAAVGIDAAFMEIHENPDLAPRDGPNMIPLDKLGNVIRQVPKVREAIGAVAASGL